MPDTVIEPVRRSFAVLEALSRRRTSTLSVLVDETALPRPTVVRLLHTLGALGYAQRVSRQQGYRLTDRVLGLSESIRFVDHLVDAAIPHMRRFTSEHGWPLYLATLSYGAITIRHSTAPESPMSFESAGLNTRRSALVSALGRAWLASAPKRSGAPSCATSAGSRRARKRRCARRSNASVVPVMPSPRRRVPCASMAWPCRSTAAKACRWWGNQGPSSRSWPSVARRSV